jgi:hypothetical protein
MTKRENVELELESGTHSGTGERLYRARFIPILDGSSRDPMPADLGMLVREVVECIEGNRDSIKSLSIDFRGFAVSSSEQGLVDFAIRTYAALRSITYTSKGVEEPWNEVNP